MTTPRYTVGSVSGFSIGERSGRGGHYGTIWYVYDRAYCHKTVGRFLSPMSRYEGVRRDQAAEQEALELAASLNAGEAA